MMKKDLIADTPIDCLTDKGERHRLRVQIGRPEPVGEDFQCQWAIRGLHEITAPIVGGDAVQSLTLTLGMIRSSLAVLEQKGYALTYPGGKESVGLDDIWFGHLDQTKKGPRTRKSRVRLRRP